MGVKSLAGFEAVPHLMGPCGGGVAAVTAASRGLGGRGWEEAGEDNAPGCDKGLSLPACWGSARLGGDRQPAAACRRRCARPRAAAAAAPAPVRRADTCPGEVMQAPAGSAGALARLLLPPQRPRPRAAQRSPQGTAAMSQLAAPGRARSAPQRGRRRGGGWQAPAPPALQAPEG